MRKQKTIKKSVSITGTGLHTGCSTTLTFYPAAENHGFRFLRSDLENKPVIKADARYVNKTQRGTSLHVDGVEVNTTEHVLAALVGLEIDNVLIELTASEPPIMDGSSIEFIKILKEAGIVEQDSDVDFFEVKEPIQYIDEETGSEMLLIPAENYQITTMVDYGTRVLNTQHAHLNHLSEFEVEFAHARTFCFLHELELLIEHNLIKGGDLNNAIVFVERELSDEEMTRLGHYFGKEKVKVRPEGVLNNLELRYSNEPARHKLLDIIGDLALVGKSIKGRIIATKPGHGPNTNFAKHLINIIEKEKKSMSKFDINKEPVMDIVEIMKTLPHRPPFLLVDKVLELDETRVVGLKNVTMNEEFFNGHFPGAPVMPGVLQVEAMAQAGGILVLKQVPDPENYLTYFLKIDNVKFKKMVLPGDTLIFELELIEPVRRGICQMRGKAYVGNNLVMQAELMAQIKKVK
ncbi:MAG: bifunctional UDP-3-O-[3-hydroxymyristoyl] N-acetylglucosamine deacetylase/3-hydroxyacyl-ACP dehydratase [Flavobacteriales bacterium]